MSVANVKLDLLRGLLMQCIPPSGALLVIYPPEEELTFREGYDEVIWELEARKIEINVLDFRTLIFDALASRGKLESVLEHDAKGDPNTYKSLAKMAQKETETAIFDAAQETPGAILLCKHTSSLFPWVSFAEVLKRTEGKRASHSVPRN